MASKTESRNVQLPNDLWARLKKLAEKDGNRTVGSLIRSIIQKHVEASNGR